MEEYPAKAINHGLFIRGWHYNWPTQGMLKCRKANYQQLLRSTTMQRPGCTLKLTTCQRWMWPREPWQFLTKNHLPEIHDSLFCNLIWPVYQPLFPQLSWVPGLPYGFGGLIATVMGRDLHEATEATPILGGELPTNRGCGLVHPSDLWDFCRLNPLKSLGWTNPSIPRFLGRPPPKIPGAEVRSNASVFLRKTWEAHGTSVYFMPKVYEAYTFCGRFTSLIC